jgi:sugar/nucleoside kinase (ribokinase family)
MLLSCGDALIDFLPVSSVDGCDAIMPVVGGSCLNIAVGMARLGAPAGFVGGISTDLFGRMIADHASASEVDLQYATRSEHQTTLAFVRSVAGDCIGFLPTGLFVAPIIRETDAAFGATARSLVLCLPTLNVTAEVMGIKDSLDVIEAVPGEGRDLRHRGNELAF